MALAIGLRVDSPSPVDQHVDHQQFGGLGGTMSNNKNKQARNQQRHVEGLDKLIERNVEGTPLGDRARELRENHVIVVGNAFTIKDGAEPQIVSTVFAGHERSRQRGETAKSTKRAERNELIVATINAALEQGGQLTAAYSIAGEQHGVDFSTAGKVWRAWRKTKQI
jgi:hypothetical protein